MDGGSGDGCRRAALQNDGAGRWATAPDGFSRLRRHLVTAGPMPNAAPLVVAVVEGEADALALVAHLRLPGVLVRAAGGTAGTGPQH